MKIAAIVVSWIMAFYVMFLWISANPRFKEDTSTNTWVMIGCFILAIFLTYQFYWKEKK